MLRLLSDAKGDLWVGTIFGGLDRYVIAENKFYHHRHSDADSATVSDDRINVLFEDSQKRIWVGTPAGLDLYDRRSDSFARFQFSEKDPVQKIAVNAICEDRNHQLWVGTTKGLFRLSLQDSTQNRTLIRPHANGTARLAEEVISLFVDDSDLLWIGTRDHELRSYDPASDTITLYPATAKGTRPIFESTDGDFWLGSAYSLGLRVLNRGTKNVSQVSNMQNDMITALYEDNSGILWIGTFLHGVYAYDPRNNRFRHYLNDPQSPNLVMAILEDHSGDLWVGTFGNGLKHIRRHSNHVETFLNERRNRNSISNNRILALAEKSDNDIWIGTVGGGLDRYNNLTGAYKHYEHRTASRPNGLSSNDVTTLYEDGNGYLWIGYYSGDIVIYLASTDGFTQLFPRESTSHILKGSTITIFREDARGTMWIGTHGSGLLRYFPDRDSISQYQLRPGDQQKSSATEPVKEISTLCLGEDGTVWVGTSRNGLVLFDPATNASTSFTAASGLPDNSIYGILSDQSGCYWLSTNSGISRFDPVSRRFKNFDKNDGLQSNEFNQGAYFQSSKGELFFGGVNGLNSFFPAKIEDNTTMPPVYLTSFKVFDEVIALPQPISTTKSIQLSHSQNFFSFEFDALSFTSPEKNQYAYKLEGFDKDWHRVSASHRYASYTNLDPGTYTLHVKGSNNDGVWNEAGASMTIIITPPFWMTWWFRLMLAAAVIGATVFVYNYRVRQLLKMERMRLRIATDLHDELGSDLSAIALTSQLTKGLDQSDRLRLERIRENSLRVIDAMREIVWFIRPEHDELAQLIARMKDVADSMLDGIGCAVNVGDDALAQLPDIESRRNLFLIYRECLANIVRHARCSHVTIDIGGEDGLLLRVADNGVGFDPHSVRRGSGLNNIQVRSQRLHASLHIESSPNSGTIMELRRAK